MSHLPIAASTREASGESGPAVAPSEAARPAAPPDASSARPDLTTLLMFLTVLVGVGHLLYLLADYRHIFVHPEWHLRILPDTVRNGASFSVQDILYALQPRNDESRPRWLMYLIVGIDQKLRLWWYQQGPVYPVLSPLAWVLQLTLAPYALYSLLVTLTRDRAAGLAGVAVYISSCGFLSGFTMLFMPGKTLSNAVFLGALYAASVATRTLRPGQLLVEAPGISKYVMLLVLFVGLFVDEMPMAAFMIVPIVFWPYFVPLWPGVSWRRWLTAARVGVLVRNSLFFALPGLAFLLVVVVIAPPLMDRAFGFRFDYIGETLLIGSNRTGTSIVEGRVSLTPAIVLENFTNLVGLSLSPWPLSPLVTSTYGDFPGSQVTNLPKLLLMALFFGAAGLVAWRKRATYGFQVLGLLVAIPLFVVFLSFVMIRHIPIVTGYYYGAGFASLFALLVGLLLAGLSAAGSGPRAGVVRPLAAVAVLAMVLVQIVNFGPINDGWIATHNEQVTRAMMQKVRSGLQRRIPLAPPPRDLTTAELDAIWAAWSRDRLDAYLRENPVSGAALYQVFELREIEPQPVRR
jgi:hypothetical protein